MAEPVRRVRGTRRQLVVLVVTVVFLTVALGSFFWQQREQGESQTWREVVRSIPTEATTVSRVSDVVARGELPDFQRLAADVEALGNSVKGLKDGDAEAGIPPVPARTQEQAKALEAS